MASACETVGDGGLAWNEQGGDPEMHRHGNHSPEACSRVREIKWTQTKQSQGQDPIVEKKSSEKGNLGV